MRVFMIAETLPSSFATTQVNPRFALLCALIALAPSWARAAGSLATLPRWHLEAHTGEASSRFGDPQQGERYDPAFFFLATPAVPAVPAIPTMLAIAFPCTHFPRPPLVSAKVAAAKDDILADPADNDLDADADDEGPDGYLQDNHIYGPHSLEPEGLDSAVACRCYCNCLYCQSNWNRAVRAYGSPTLEHAEHIVTAKGIH
ncbi:hypothetical protein C8R43DRAFT_1140286 [Mycena crocata]|nr:hypothetical protein C8R43DRAFT_1140286 [Mycena crocata]